MLRTHTCGELTEKNIGQNVTLSGWVDTVRDHGGVTFIDVRDRYGKTQVVAGQGAQFKSEEVVRVTGTVERRPQGTENSKLPTGQIEITKATVELLNSCQALPFEVTKSQETNEELRMTYRYLDLRNPSVQKNLFARHKIYQVMRQSLDKHNFIEVETPILTKSTPEGARDYLVPSRVNQGEFYALPQSPQLFKQILMVSGFDRYFQIAKCFRDEDLRADRQPEFTQLDLEMSFIDEKDLFVVVEDVMKNVFKEVMGRDLKTPFVQLTYQDAMAKYGSDKPDLRFGMEIKELSSAVKGCEFKIFNEAVSAPKSGVFAIVLSGGAAIPRSEIDALTEFVKAEGAGGLAYFKVTEAGLEAPIAKFFKPEMLAEIKKVSGANAGDMIFFAAGDRHKSLKILGALRLHLGKTKKLMKADEFHFSWVIDFPLFAYDAEEKRWASEHHPFTSPNVEDWKKFKSDGNHEPVRSRAYDLVLNGNEIASGSIRIHSEAMQKEIFEAIGLAPEEIQKRFGFLLKAFQFGAPPHGGAALGIDRVLTILLGLDSIREVIAFPKNQKAVCPMTEAPSQASERQLKEVGIKLR